MSLCVSYSGPISRYLESVIPRVVQYLECHLCVETAASPATTASV